MSNGKLMLIDGNSILHRAFHGLQGPQGSQLLATSDGLYTNAVFGFLNILFKFIDEEKPQYICVAFDLKAPTFRHKEFDAYKANRKAMPEELAVQFPVIKEVLDAMNIRRLECEGFEADDIIGSVSLWGEENGLNVVILTGDRDSLQLVSEKVHVKILTKKAGKNVTEEYDVNKVMEVYEVTPTQFIDVKGLMGDTSDNIPGVRGIGEATAIDLIKRFKSIESLYEDIDNVEKKSVKEKLAAGREMAYLSKRLATIERRMVCTWGIEDLKRKDFDEEKLYPLFQRLEFRSFIEKFKLGGKVTKEYVTKQVECIREMDGLRKIKDAILTTKELSVLCLIDKVGDFASSLVGAAISWEKDKSAYLSFNECINEDDFFNEFKEILESKDIKKYGHDVKGLIVYLKNKGIELNGLAFDTMIGAYIIDPSSETYTVSELAAQHLDLSMEPLEQLSGKGKSFTLYRDMQLEKISSAAGMHSEAIFNFWPKLNDIILENGQKELYYDIELPLVEVLADMEYHGFKVNIDELREFSKELEGKINLLTKDIYLLAGEEFNINSTKQLGVILFEKLGLPVLKKTKTGYSTDAEILEQLAQKHEIVSKILEYRQLVKLKSTYAEGLLNVINPANGKIHSSFNQTVTVTGRISSTEPNLQNIPIKLEMGRLVRKVFIPESEEFILSDADYSQIELRVLAHITEDENMIAAFKGNEDIHTTTASRVFGIAKENVTSLMRSRAKAVNFGIVYGIGAFSLSKDLGITRKEAGKYIDEYLSKYPKVRDYMHNIVEDGKEAGFVTTLFKRRRYLPELKSSNGITRSFGERIAMNTPIQGSAADIIKIAMVKVYRALKDRKLKSRLILQVHDELIIETHRDEREEVAEILKESMENAMSLKVPLSVDVKTGSNWYETK